MKFCILIFIFLPVFLSAQAVSPAVELENLLNTEVVTYAQASRFVLEASEVMVVSDPEEAFRFALRRGWLPKKAGPDDPAQLKHISRLLMRSFYIKGGLFYSMTKNSRYAYHELKYMDVIQGRVDATMPVSGERLIFYVNRLLSRQDIRDSLDERKQAQERMKVRLEALISEIERQIERQTSTNNVVISISNNQLTNTTLQNIDDEKTREIVGILNTIPDIRVLVVSNITERGTEIFLYGLSQERARFVIDSLVSRGVCNAANAGITGYGGPAANRRVEILLGN